MENQYQNRNTAIVIIIALIILGVASFRVIFPVFSMGSSENDNFLTRSIGGKKYLELKIKQGYPFHRVVVKIKTKDSLAEVQVLKKIYQNELGLYTAAGIIDTEEQLQMFLSIKKEQNIQNGELIQKGNEVYFIGGGQRRAFSNAETFDKLGFQWDKVQKNKEEYLTSIQKGKKITLATAYLPGSFVQINTKIYLLGNESRYEINKNNESLIDFIKNKFSVIKIDKKVLSEVGLMDCSQKNDEVVCEFKDDKQKVFPRATVIIESSDSVVENQGDAQVYTFDKFNSVVPKITLRKIKERLAARYGERLGIKAGIK